MKILVSNLGSTSFKYRLFELDGVAETLLAKGGYERVEDFGPVIEDCIKNLEAEGHLTGADDLDAVGFKTVLGKDLSGCVEADEKVLAALAGFEAIAPAHNPAYANGIKMFAKVMPKVTRVALFETAFYQWMSPAACRYAV
ncbi:MAG: acetate kinase, partial [Puniceicoccales bacterium]